MSMFLNLLALSIVLLFAFLKYSHSYWKRRGVPHETPPFPWGDFKEWRNTKCFYEILTPIYRKFKGTAPFAGMFMAIRPVALILDPDLVKSILIKDFNHFRERGIFSNVRDDPLTGHLFALEGTKWRELRHKLSPAFSSGKMKHMHSIVVKVAEEFKKVLEEKQATAAGGVIEITDLLSCFTADVIGVCAFGIECNSLRNPQAEFVVMGRKANTERRHGLLLDQFIEAAPKLARTLRMRQIPQNVNDFYMGIVRETIEYRERTGVKRNDLMDVLMELKSKDGKDGGLTVNEIVAQAFVFLVAGFETSSSTMGYALYELAKCQDIQNRLRAEINAVLKLHNNQFTYESMQDMRYMEQVISETLRRYPILPHLVREADINYKTSDPRFTIEKDTTVIIPVYELHHDPKYFPNPEKFDPERFSEAGIKTRPSCTYVPFGDGPRNCIGFRFGKMQVCIGLTYLLRNFKFSVCEETEERLNFLVEKMIIQPVNGIKLRVERL